MGVEMEIDYGRLAAHVASGLGALKGYGHQDTAAVKSLQYVLDELMAAYEAAKVPVTGQSLSGNGDKFVKHVKDHFSKHSISCTSPEGHNGKCPTNRQPVGYYCAKHQGASSVESAACMECYRDKLHYSERHYLRLQEMYWQQHKALSFASSVIKSGEPWTSTCDEIIGGALRQDGRPQYTQPIKRKTSQPDDCLAAFEDLMREKRLSTEKVESDVPPFKNRRVEAMWEGFICAWGMPNGN
jgi:hypothetical protein